MRDRAAVLQAAHHAVGEAQRRVGVVAQRAAILRQLGVLGRREDFDDVRPRQPPQQIDGPDGQRVERPATLVDIPDPTAYRPLAGQVLGRE